MGIARAGLPSYRQILSALGMVPVDLPAAPANRYQPVAADFAGLDLAGLMVASPRQPDRHHAGPGWHGGADRRGAGAGRLVLSDEIYHGLEYEKKA